MKRNLIIALVVVLISAVGYFWYSLKDTPFSKELSVFKAIPVSAPLFIEVSSIQSIPYDNPIVQELDKDGIGKNWFSFLQKTDSLISSSGKLPNSLRGSNFILAFGFTGRNELFPVIIKKVETQNRQQSIELLIQQFFPHDYYSYHQRKYGKNIVNEVIPKNSGNPVFYSYTDELFFVSPKSILVEQILRQLSTPGILKNPFFLEAVHGMGDEKISLYINHEWISEFFNTTFSRAVTEKTDEFGGVKRYQPAAVAEKFKNFAGWSKLGIRFFSDRIFLNGISSADDSLNHFLPVFEGQQPVRSNAEKVLPRNTSFFCNFSFSDKNDFFKRLEAFYTHSDNFYLREERMKRFDQGFQDNTRSVFQKWAKDEIIVATTVIPVNPEYKTTFFILPTANGPAAEKELQFLLKKYAARTDKDFNQMVSTFTDGHGVNFTIYRFPFPSFPGLWIGHPFTMVKAEFAVFYEDFLVFSNSGQGLHEYLRSMVLGTTLAKDTRYQQFNQNHPNRANINVFIDVNKALGFRSEVFPPKILKLLEEKEEGIRKFSMINLQIRHEKNTFPNTISLAYQPDAGEESQTAWQAAIGSEVATKPHLVRNHDHPGQYEIIFQDSGNNLHLISNSGDIRWSVTLPGPILGEIHQIDYYRNGKLQYLFNTREKLYLLDRNGKNVDKFPVQLQSPATNAMSVFDYDNTRNYRYFVAGENKKIYAYDVSGKSISGWKFSQTDQPVTTPVQHFKVEGKDYIVFKDQLKIYIVDRQGEIRVSPDAQFENSGNILAVSLTGKPKMVTTDTGGKVYYIYFDGKCEVKTTGRFSEKHFFTSGDLDGNGVYDFIFADGNEILVMDENGKKMFSKKLDNPVTIAPAIYTFSENLKKVGVVDAMANRIYLYNPDGKIHPGFPLPGNSEFTIGKLTGNSEFLNLLTGSEGGVLSNYSLPR